MSRDFNAQELPKAKTIDTPVRNILPERVWVEVQECGECTNTRISRYLSTCPWNFNKNSTPMEIPSEQLANVRSTLNNFFKHS